MRRIVFVLAVFSVLPWAPARANPVTQDACPGSASVAVWKKLGNNVLENLLFTDGSLWISDGARVRRFGPDGTEQQGLSTVITAAGGLAAGPDGLIYAGSGNSIGNAVMRTGAASVLRFDPADPNGSVETYASRQHMPNRMTFDASGDLYISNDFDAGLVRIPRANPAAWSLVNDTYGTNGLVIRPDGVLYSAITFDSRSPIEMHDVTTGAHRTAIELTAGAVSLEPAVYAPDTTKPLVGLKGLDDMTMGPDGDLYPVANGMGELLRVVFPKDGASSALTACLVAGGLQNPSSVRVAPEDGPFADADPATLDFYVTEFSGAIKTVRYRAA